MTSAVPGLSIALSLPPWMGGGVLADDVAELASGYGHTIAAVGGYKSANFNVSVPAHDIGRWLEFIGYEITVTARGMETIWQGVINSISTNVGGVSISRGPFLEIRNKVRVDYQETSYSVLSVQVGGNQLSTDWASDTVSIKRYGQLEGRVSGGSGYSDEMDGLRDAFLSERKDPANSQSVAVGGGGESGGTVSVQVQCVGYGDLLKAVLYEQTATAADVNADVKIKAVLAAHPSLTFNVSRVASNASLLVNEYEEGTATMEGIITNIASAGDSSGNRWIFGIYEDLRATYEQIPADISYYYRLDQAASITDVNGAEVQPWEVVPGRWMLLADLFPTAYIDGSWNASRLRTDPRAIFIEQISYTAPRSVSVQGGKTGTVAQQLKRMGLGGM